MKIVEYTLKKGSLEVKFLNLGAIITEINYKGINRVLRFKKLDSYLNNTMYLGAIVGRTAGRIENGVFPGGKLQTNFLNKHNLHGNDMHLKYYNVDMIDESTATLSVIDSEGEYPGDLDVSIKYSILNDSLNQEILARSTAMTPINMTNHTYFNLNGTGTILDHQLQIDSTQVGILNHEMITSDFGNVAKTAFDFRHNRVIRTSLEQGDDQFEISGFIDHPYKLDGLIQLLGNDCRMTIKTNQPYVVAYLGSQIDAEMNELLNSSGKKYSALCLETQKCPGDTELVDEYYSITQYEFKDK